jgi:hypothetical protein
VNPSSLLRLDLQRENRALTSSSLSYGAWAWPAQCASFIDPKEELAAEC